MVRPELIIFDCDGVLIDSEIIAHRVCALEMTRIGFSLTVEKSIELFSGVANEDLADVIRKEYSKSISDSKMENILKKIENSFSADLKSVPEISQVIDCLEQKQIRKCIASNSMYDYVITALTITGLNSYFNKDLIFSAEMVKRGKPEPDLFLHVTDKLQVNPENCIVIEDSIVGIEAAKTANMPVIGFLGGAHAKNSWYYESIIKMEPLFIANDAVELCSILESNIF